MKKYEYRILYVGDGRPESVERALNEVAGKGFRCFHVQINQNSSVYLYMEREAEP